MNHPHRTRKGAKKRGKAPVQATTAGGADKSREGAADEVPPKRAWVCMGLGCQESSDADRLSAMLGLDKDPSFDVQEAFGSLLNAQDILGSSADKLAEEAEGEMSFRRAYEKLHHPTPSVSGSMEAAGISVNGSLRFGGRSGGAP